LSFGTPLALVGIVVILREVFVKHDVVLEGRMPRGVTVIAALSILGGANLILGGTGNVLSPPVIIASDLAGIVLPAGTLALVSTIFLFLAFVALGLGSLKILAGLVLRTGKSWALGSWNSNKHSIDFPRRVLARGQFRIAHDECYRVSNVCCRDYLSHETVCESLLLKCVGHNDANEQL
jgi:hypothetical protein